MFLIPPWGTRVYNLEPGGSDTNTRKGADRGDRWGEGGGARGSGRSGHSPGGGSRCTAVMRKVDESLKLRTVWGTFRAGGCRALLRSGERGVVLTVLPQRTASRQHLTALNITLTAERSTLYSTGPGAPLAMHAAKPRASLTTVCSPFAPRYPRLRLPLTPPRESTAVGCGEARATPPPTHTVRASRPQAAAGACLPEVRVRVRVSPNAIPN